MEETHGLAELTNEIKIQYIKKSLSASLSDINFNVLIRVTDEQMKEIFKIINKE